MIVGQGDIQGAILRGSATDVLTRRDEDRTLPTPARRRLGHPPLQPIAPALKVQPPYRPQLGHQHASGQEYREWR